MNVIPQLIATAGVSRAEVAKRLDCDLLTVARYEAGEPITPPHNEQLAQMFGVSPVLVRGEFEPWGAD